MDPLYIVLLMGVGFTMLGAASTALFEWLTGRPIARNIESQGVIKQLTGLIKELQIARDRDRKDATENREAIARLELQVKRLEERIEELLMELQDKFAHIAELRKQLHGVGVEPSAEPDKS